MERLSIEVQDLVLLQPPIQLLGYVMCLFHLAIMESNNEARKYEQSQSETLKKFQFILEYLHAVWSCSVSIASEEDLLDESKAETLFSVLENLQKHTVSYCHYSSALSGSLRHDRRTADIEFFAKTSWFLIRGQRYQVLEEEFFEFALAPHSDALQVAYSLGPKDIAVGIQSIANAMRTGVSIATEKLHDSINQVCEVDESEVTDISSVSKNLALKDDKSKQEMLGYVKDILYGGICNLSRHSSLTSTLLEDLSYFPGENKEFYSPGEFSGTPMRTLPGRLKPGIKLGNDFYATDGQFIRDAAYRAIQRGLCLRIPYRTEWLKRQGELIERAFTLIFHSQLNNIKALNSVYYKDIHSGKWVETDLVVIVEDVLIVIEAKAGSMPMHSPATSFASHERIIESLIVAAYKQCNRFVEFVFASPKVELYSLTNGQYAKVADIRRSDYRVVLPIGLTIESFSPFSAMAKRIPAVQPICGRYHFMSMAVDDFFVIRRILPSLGQLMHYFEERQHLAGLSEVMLFDEIDHLGAYVSSNRIDLTLRQYQQKADIITVNQFSDVIDSYFSGPDWDAKPIPSQEIPPTLERILVALDRKRPANWLRMDSFLRDFDEAGRKLLADRIDFIEVTLSTVTKRRIQIGGTSPIIIWICRPGSVPQTDEIEYHAQIGCLAFKTTRMMVLTLVYKELRTISQVFCTACSAPTVLQTNYDTLKTAAKLMAVKIKHAKKSL